MRSDDESLTAPGSDAIKRLLGDEPSLILIDEIARYYAVAKGVAVGQTTLAGQTTAFLMALMEAVDALPHAVLVMTTTGLTDAFGEDTADVLKAIDEARELMARKELRARSSLRSWCWIQIRKLLSTQQWKACSSSWAPRVPLIVIASANRASALSPGTTDI